jgi:hypothetical protein
MRSDLRVLPIISGALLTILLCGGGRVALLGAKDKVPGVSSDDPTFRLYNLLDSKLGGKLEDFRLLGDTINDPQNPGQVQQHVLRVDYDKGRGFGKLRIVVRTVAQLTPEQLKAYTINEIYDFGESDSEKFTKTDPGSFGRQGDVYFQPTTPGGALGSAPVTDAVQARYERYVTQYILPALEKKAAGGGGL